MVIQWNITFPSMNVYLVYNDIRDRYTHDPKLQDQIVGKYSHFITLPNSIVITNLDSGDI